MKQAIDYIYKTEPFQHQRDAFIHSRELEAFALFMEQGTGKTKVIIDTAAYLYNADKIRTLVVIAPRGVHYNWIDELARHMPDYIKYEVLAWDSGRQNTKAFKMALKDLAGCEELRVFTINIDAVNIKNGYQAVERFLLSSNTLLVVDESHTIKNPKAQRTKKILKFTTKAEYRRILTGTPVIQSPLDLYTQMNFLDPNILGQSSYFAFRNRYAVLEQERNWRTEKIYHVVRGYQNLKELSSLVAPHSVRVLKKECLDLPDKLYTRVYVDLTKDQRRLYDQLKETLIAEFAGEIINVQMALTKMLRLMQITGGNFPTEEGTRPIDPITPKAQALLDVLDALKGTSTKVIIWARFTAEVEEIHHLISESYGRDSVVTYYGAMSTKQRLEALARFKHPEGGVQFFIGNPQAGGTGLDLWEASTVIYYSNDFSLGSRLQSEDRAHRIGQTKNVTYIDLIARNTLDEYVVKVLRDKKNLADVITGDNITKWL